MMLLGLMLLAHSWYPYECCGDGDCAPLSPKQVKIIGEQYEITLADHSVVHVPLSSAKISEDDNYHVCIGKIVSSPRCFFRPKGEV